jgi:sialate O-acetylesterase
VAGRQAAWYRANDAGTSATIPWQSTLLDDSGWATMALPAAWEEAGLPGFDGVVWFRKEVELPASAVGKPMTLSLGTIDDQDATFVNGVPVGAMDTWNAMRSYAVPAGVARAGRNVIAVRVLDTSGAGGLTGKPEALTLQVEDGPAIPLAGPWRYKATADLTKAPPFPMSLGANPNLPTVLYNGMIAPVLPYAIKGSIWYQGESNAGRAWQYRTLLPTMIADWRQRFESGDFPFLIVSLANFMERKPEPSDSQWAELREAQAYTVQTVPKTGLAISVDIGDPVDIHPKNKQDVGHRLALAARKIAYGEKGLVASGPVFRGMAVEGNAIRLRFDNVGGGLVAKDGKLAGFAIAGADRKFVWAEARIDGDTIVVSSPAVPNPVAVRYAWADNPDATLFNKAGLPAVPFRTDDWPLTTQPKP